MDSTAILHKNPRSMKKATRRVRMAPSTYPETTRTIEQKIPKAVRTDGYQTEHQPYTPFSIRTLTAKPANSTENLISTYKNNRFCSTRAAIATFVIIIILIIAAGTSVGIVFASINARSSSATGNSENTQVSFSTVSSGTLTSSVSIGSQTGSPCSGYTEINDPTRNYNLSGSSSSCDNGPLFHTSNGGAWIRFVGTGGTTIASSAPGLQHCGAFLPGWYNGTLPSNSNPIVNGTVCFETVSFQCGYNVPVSVAYCSGGYYVYFLPPVALCNARYCTA